MPDRCAVLVVALACTGIGCGDKSEQSFAAAMRTLCDAPDRCCVGETDPGEKATKMARWITDHVTNREVVARFGSLAAIEGMDAKLAILREDVKRAGIDPARCAILHPWSTGPSL